MRLGERTHPDSKACARPLLRSALAVVAAAIALLGRPATALGDISTDDLQAIARSLGFLDTLPKDGTIAVGVVYAGDSAAAAGRTAERLNATQGPNSATFKAQGVAVGALAGTTERLDALLLESGVCTDPANAQKIADAVRQRHLVSISTEPACLESKCCVLMVHTDRKVEIVLDTAMADAVGARFSSVFAMMVKRK